MAEITSLNMMANTDKKYHWAEITLNLKAKEEFDKIELGEFYETEIAGEIKLLGLRKTAIIKVKKCDRNTETEHHISASYWNADNNLGDGNNRSKNKDYDCVFSLETQSRSGTYQKEPFIENIK